MLVPVIKREKNIVMIIGIGFFNLIFCFMMVPHMESLLQMPKFFCVRRNHHDTTTSSSWDFYYMSSRIGNYRVDVFFLCNWTTLKQY